MPLYDVHQRRIVRIKHPSVEADGPLAAIQRVESDRAMIDEASRRFRNASADSGLITDIEVDDGEPPASYLVDLVGDVDYLHTLDYSLMPDGTYAIHRHEAPASAMQSRLHGALKALAPAASDAQHPLRAFVDRLAAGLADDDLEAADRRLLAAISRLQALRSALHLETRDAA